MVRSPAGQIVVIVLSEIEDSFEFQVTSALLKRCEAQDCGHAGLPQQDSKFNKLLELRSSSRSCLWIGILFPGGISSVPTTSVSEAVLSGSTLKMSGLSPSSIQRSPSSA
jgi:hypothetical protein